MKIVERLKGSQLPAVRHHEFPDTAEVFSFDTREQWLAAREEARAAELKMEGQ